MEFLLEDWGCLGFPWVRDVEVLAGLIMIRNQDYSIPFSFLPGAVGGGPVSLFLFSPLPDVWS